jgi:hypothetical protein
LNPKRNQSRLVLGEDVEMAHVMDLSALEVVENARGRIFSAKTLKEWEAMSWEETLGYVLVVKVMARGWFVFKFLKEEDANWVLRSPWSVDSTLVFFKLWIPLFDVGQERLDVIPIWVQLPFLPLGVLVEINLHAHW